MILRGRKRSAAQTALATCLALACWVASAAPASAYYFNRNQYLDLGLSEPRALFLAPSPGGPLLWVLDREQSRIIAADLTGRIVRTIEGNGPASFRRPSGLWVSASGDVYVGDTGNRRVLRIDPSGTLTAVYQPAAEDAAFFNPEQIAVDLRGYVYVLNGGQSILVFEPGGRLVGTLTESGDRPGQLGLLTALTLDAEGYIYVAYTTGSSRNPRGQIARYDYQGRLDTVFNPGMRSRFTALAVDELGNVYAVNEDAGNLFKFDRRGKLMFQSGSLGPLRSSVRFAAGVAVAASKEVFVLDTSQRIQVLEPSSLSLLIDEANAAFRRGDYDTAQETWEAVIRLNNYLDVAHVGLGDTFMQQQRWQDAIREFELGGDVWRHSLALRQYRAELLARHGWWLVVGWIAACSLALAVGRFWRRRIGDRFLGRIPVVRLAFGMLRHPLRTMREVPGHIGIGSAAALVAWVWLVNTLDAVVINPLFPGAGGGDQFLFLKRLGILFFLWAVWSAVTFGVGEVLGGEGKLRDFFTSSALALAPYAIFSLPVHAATNLLTLYEKVYFDRANALIVAWCAVLLFLQTRIYHRFGDLRAGVSFALSLGATVLAIGCAGLLLGVNSRVITFVQEVAAEIYNYTV
ncbi:MAG TPA: NHL repeat-containing protein [Limnochordia bacterium]